MNQTRKNRVKDKLRERRKFYDIVRTAQRLAYKQRPKSQPSITFRFSYVELGLSYPAPPKMVRVFLEFNPTPMYVESLRMATLEQHKQSINLSNFTTAEEVTDATNR